MRIFAILSALAVAAVSQAIVLDAFDDGNMNSVISAVFTPTYTQSAATVPGGNRVVGQEISVNLFGLTHAAVVTNGVFVSASKSGVTAQAAVGYGYDNQGDPGTDLNLDLSAYNAFTWTVLSNDNPANMRMFLRSNGVDSNDVTKVIAPNMVSTSQTITFDFSDFIGVDFSDIDQIAMVIDGTSDADTVVDTFEAVPEPGTMIALGAGLAAIAARRKRKTS